MSWGRSRGRSSYESMWAPYVPVANAPPAGFVSSRVGNYQISPVYGLLPGQMWVR